MRSKVRTRIGSMLVCLAMLLSLLPVTALAAEGTECTESDCAHVAAIGNTHYGTLADAFNAAIDGDTVKVLKDSNIDEGIEISEGNVVLDLNGKTVSYVQSKSNDNVGIIDINGTANVMVTGNGSFTYTDGYYNSPNENELGYIFRVAGNAKLTIEDGNYHAVLTCVQAGDSSEVVIKDGTFSTGIEWGGTRWHLNLMDGSDAKFTVMGGAFEGFDPGASKTENPVANFCAPGYISVTEDGGMTYTVHPLEDVAVAEANGEYYMTLAEAVETVVSSSGKTGTVTLLKDAQGCGIGLFNGKGHVGVDLTIDFGGHTYTAGDPAVGSVGTESQAFHLEKDNTVTLKNGTITVAPDSQNTAMLIRNYCNLTLDNIDLIGNNRTQYIISCNYGDTVLKDVNISGTYGNLVALDLMHWLGTSYADQVPTMSIQNTAENTISGSVDIYCYGTGADSCPSKPVMTITGGTFTTDVKDYCATGYTTKQDGSKYVVVSKDGMEADSSASGSTSSGTVGGTFNPSTENGDNVDTSGSTIEINVATGSDGSQNAAVNHTSIEIASDALTSVSSTNYDVAITTDVAVLTVSQEAWADITQNANGKNVTLGLTKGGTETNPVYTLTAQADGENVYSADNASGKITVAVKATAEAPIYYVREDGSLENMNAAFENGVITWDVTHFSDYVAASGKVGLVADGKVSFYNTIANAIDAMSSVTSGTITLLDNMTESVTIPTGKTVLLELNGKTLTNNAGSHTITVTLGSNLTVQDSVGGGLVDNVSHARAAILNNGTATLNGGKYDRSKENGQNSENAGGNSYYAIVNHGTMTINDGVTVAQNGHFSSMIENGYQNYNSSNASTGYVSGTNAANPSLTINGGSFSGGLNTVKNDDGGKLEINGGRFSNVSQAVVLNWNTATITGGDFTVTEPGVNSVILNGFADGTLDMGKLEIKGGTFTSTTGAPVLTTMGGATHSGDINISGGTLNGDIVLTDAHTGGKLEISETAVINGDVINQKAASVTVTGGSVTGQVSNNGSGKITITGGTFPNADISDFVDSSATAIITFNSNGGSAVATQVVAKNNSISLPTTTRSGYNFLGWYLNDSRVGGHNDSYKVTGNVTLVARWSYINQGGGTTEPSGDYQVTVDRTTGGKISVSPSRADKGDTVTITVKPDKGYELDKLIVTNKDGDSIKLTKKDDNKFTFKMPGSRVEVEASFKKTVEEPTNPFTDVYESNYYYDAVLWAVENGVTNGTSATTFGPNVTVTRAQMVTFLWRAHGSPKATGTNPFTDVSTSDYYYDAVLWAVANGVTTGTSATTFSPDAPVTRAQAVTFQWRAAGSPVVSGSSFSDVAADAYYVNAVTWAVANGITNGTSGTTFSPDAAVSRAQAVTFLWRELA